MEESALLRLRMFPGLFRRDVMDEFDLQNEALRQSFRLDLKYKTHCSSNVDNQRATQRTGDTHTES